MKKILMFSLAGLMLSVPLAVHAEQGADDSKMHKGGHWFEKVDANSDGFLTKEEFMAEPEQRFIESDTDKDGKISKAEADAQKEKWRAKLKEEREKRKAEREKMKSEQGKVEVEKKDAEKPAQ